MIWQDYAITLVIYMFVIVTIPQIIDVLKKKTRLNLLTTNPTVFGNYQLLVVFASLGLWISVTSSLLIATFWLIIFIGSWRKWNTTTIKGNTVAYLDVMKKPE